MNYYMLDEALMYLEEDDVLSMLERQVASVIELTNDPIFEGFEVVEESNSFIKTSEKIKVFLRKLLEKIKALIAKASYAVAEFADRKIFKHVKGKTIPEDVKTLNLYNITAENLENDWGKCCDDFENAINKFEEDVHRLLRFNNLEQDLHDKELDLSSDKIDIFRTIKDLEDNLSNIAKNKTEVKITDKYAKDPQSLYVQYTSGLYINYRWLLDSFNDMNKAFEQFEKNNYLNHKDSSYFYNKDIVRGLSGLTNAGFNMLKMSMSNAYTILKACK